MNKLIFLISIFLFSTQVAGNCKYPSSTIKNLDLSFTSTQLKILSDNTVPIGSVLYANAVGVDFVKTYYDCDVVSADPDVYRVQIQSPEVPGITGIQGRPVYETGIDGIGFQIGDLLYSTVPRPVPTAAGIISPVPKKAYDGNMRQMPVWLIKTGPINTSQTSGRLVNIVFSVGAMHQVMSPGMLEPILMRADFQIKSIQYRASSCNISLRGGNPVELKEIDIAQLRAASSSGSSKTGKQKQFFMDMTCPSASQGKSYIYWFNPISGNSSSSDGVLNNMLSPSAGGAKNVGFIIKGGSTGTTPIKFYDFSSYQIFNTKASQEIKLEADYYKLSNDISHGDVRALLEVVVQEK
ncbi:fimbrial protein [Entomohabitans teleogrylli]|uniref:fimbrial protein n=1 Tax=Entomohabitans teleogrylli TaxID=1384589 RepID=UPI00073D43E0|nr:fimbrial protein [Entomohabitans teleogrylli]